MSNDNIETTLENNLYFKIAMKCLNEMEEEKVRSYMFTYLKLGLKEEDFFVSFGEYVDGVKPDSKGWKRLSQYGFKNYLIGKNEINNRLLFDKEEHMIRLELWNSGIIEEINDPIPERYIEFYKVKLD